MQRLLPTWHRLLRFPPKRCLFGSAIIFSVLFSSLPTAGVEIWGGYFYKLEIFAAQFCDVLNFPAGLLFVKDKKANGEHLEGKALLKDAEGLEMQEWEDFYIRKVNNVILWKSCFLISKALKYLNFCWKLVGSECFFLYPTKKHTWAVSVLRSQAGPWFCCGRCFTVFVHLEPTSSILFRTCVVFGEAQTKPEYSAAFLKQSPNHFPGWKWASWR